MTYSQLTKFAGTSIAKYPMLKETIRDFVALAADEIENGADSNEECEMAVASIESVIREHKESLR